jgi:hypothetical protein
MPSPLTTERMQIGSYVRADDRLRCQIVNAKKPTPKAAKTVL